MDDRVPKAAEMDERPLPLGLAATLSKELIHAGEQVHCLSVDTLLYCEKPLTNPLARKPVRRLKRGGVPFARVTPDQFRRVSKTERVSGVAVIFRQRVQRLDQIGLVLSGPS